jgi:hypothetical protein
MEIFTKVKEKFDSSLAKSMHWRLARKLRHVKEV